MVAMATVQSIVSGVIEDCGKPIKLLPGKSLFSRITRTARFLRAAREMADFVWSSNG